MKLSEMRFRGCRSRTMESVSAIRCLLRKSGETGFRAIRFRYLVASTVALVCLSSQETRAQLFCTNGANYSCRSPSRNGLTFTANPDSYLANENMVLRGGGSGQPVRNYFVGNADNANQSNVWIGDAGYTNSTTTIYANHFAVGDSTTSASGANAAAIGPGAVASQANTLALGAESQATGREAVALGGRSTAAAQAGTALGAGSRVTGEAHNAVALGAGSVADEADTVSVGAAGAERRIVNVAPGIARTDAVNVGQLRDVESALNDRMNILQGTVLETRKEARQGVAAAVAMTTAPMPSAPGRTSWAMNLATFKGEYAFGGSLAHRFDAPIPIALTAGHAYGGGKSHAARVGLQGEF